MIIICAVDKNYGVGKNGILPWKNSVDLKHFKKITMGKIVLVGRKTCEKMPNLQGRKVVILTGNILTTFINHDDVYLIGGPTVWKVALENKMVSEIIMTCIDGEYDCDVFFPKEYLTEFKEIEKYYLDEKTFVVRYILLLK